MELLWLLLLPLAVQMLTYIMMKEKPFEWYRNLAERWAPNSLGYAINCIICTTTQVAIALSLLFFFCPIAYKLIAVAFTGARLALMFDLFNEYFDLKYRALATVQDISDVNAFKKRETYT